MGEIIYNFYPLNVIIDDLSAFNALKMIFQWKVSTWCGGTANAMQSQAFSKVHSFVTNQFYHLTSMFITHI